MSPHTDRVAVITGASRGIGAGLAEHFLACGMKVVACARTEPPTWGHPERVLSRSLDVRDADAVDQLAADAIERFGAIDLWINNAGVLDPIAPLREVESSDFQRHLEINVLGVFHGSRAFVRHVRKANREGVLVNISSGAARNAYSGWSAYCAGKAAVDRMTEAIALEEADTKLRAYSVAPGIIDTDMQTMIRATPAEKFPMVDKFHELKKNDGYSSTEFVAAKLLDLCFDPAHRPEAVAVSLPLEKDA